ncbi:hypothetical protein PDESU_01135 [Pontiella desulfatans]|uniref:Sialate O-acetylesterase domain-containing protein n=1 Tax=Pontiella desulfatans TaxID=2750659 RepID=A0A6C2TY68_PONDE|nr:sialate O-acetylesterase [Pontiella desulfatans]VGO12582.1 hypothetical protein PDESU_01135 [Pontiella desulfatans]
MTKTTSVVAAALIAISTQAENLRITFGAEKDLASSAGTPTQNKDIAKPRIHVQGLENGCSLDVQFSVAATGGKPARMGMGYRLDEGYALTFRIESAVVSYADGKTESVSGRFISVAGNNQAGKFTTDNQGKSITLKSTTKGNNRIRNIVAEFDLAVTGSAAPVVQKATPKPAAPAKPKPAAAPPVVKTESLKLPRLFCDHMILQQQTKNTFWGWAKPGEAITVKASWGAEASAKAGSNGRWKLLLETPKYGTGHSLTIRGAKDTIKIKNVAIGEVWLCAGQSNMGWAMGNCFETEQDPDVNLPNLRIFKSAREHWHEPLAVQRDRLSQWKPCNPDSAAETSAVSYWFAKKLHQELGIPVGIIQQAFAGTPIEGWMPWELQKDDPRAQAHKALLDASAERQVGSGTTEQKALAEFKKLLAEYNAKIDVGETMKNSVKPLAPPIITKPATLGHQYPAHMFNAMINPMIPYGIRGMIWYQGERNSKDVPQAFHYRNQLAQLISYYRTTWHEQSGGNIAADFPFQFTQLPSWTPPQTDPVEGLSAPWAVNRESMMEVARKVPNTGMAVSIDTGDATALHPKNKKPIGLRHAAVALKQTYGKDFATSPLFKRKTVDGRKIILEFDSVGSGLMAAKPGKLDTFAIAGADQVWHWAEAKIEGNTVVVSSSKVRKPVAVRYAWAMNPSQRNLLYNKVGMPVSPFRTDDWPLFDPDAEIVTVKKPAKPEKKTETDWERPAMMQ